MEANERKVQILALLREQPLTLRELSERAGIERKHLNVLTFRYRHQYLIARTNDHPLKVKLTDRGHARLAYLTKGGVPTDLEGYDR